jgi:hypothetical protein
MGETKDRRCPECGSNPSLGYDAPAVENKVKENPTLPSLPPAAAKSTARRRKPLNFMLKLIGGWSLFVISIVVLTKIFWVDLPQNREFVSKEEQERRKISPEDLALLDAAVPLCNQAFSGFLNASTPEERNQFVLSPITTAARMARFYGLNSSTNFDPKTLSLVRNAVLHLPSGPAIETQWKSKTGGDFDVVFMKENGEWRLDWNHYVRYSDYPLPLFAVGSGEEEGEFRLLARERLASERQGLDTLSIVLCNPRLGYAKDSGFQSPPILVPRDSKNGKLLMAAFKLEKEKKRVFGVNLPTLNPEEMIRVRVKVRRTQTDLGYQFEILDVLACHWYSEDAPGIDLPPPPAKP